MKSYHKNPRKITTAEQSNLKQWLEELGDLSGVVHDLNSDEIIGGNQRAKAFGILFQEKAPIVIRETFDPPTKQGTVGLGYVQWRGEQYGYRQVRWTEQQCKKANIVANKAGGDWDWDLLGNWDEKDLLDWGFDADELDAVDFGDDEPKNKTPKIDEAPELRKKWQTELGQTWQMGNHTLFIGSAESAGIECDFAVFDPPFDWAWQRQENALSWGIWKTVLVMGLAQCMPLAVRDDFWHWWVWDAGMNRFGGRGHRPVTGCAMIILLGEHCWHEEAGLAALDRHEIKHFDWPTQVVHIQDHLAGREYKHEKPYPLTDYILSLYSVRGDIVGDLFAGSGAFLIACENLKRQYRGAELSPENAAVILDRWTRTFEVEPLCL